MDGHRQLTGHQLIASVVDGNQQFVCLECVVESILRPMSPQAAICAKSLLDAAAADPRLVEYVLGRFLRQPHLLLVDFLSRQRLSASQLTTLMLNALDSSPLTPEAVGLSIHLVNSSIRLSPVHLLMDHRLLNALCVAYDRGCSSTKLEILELLRYLIRQPDIQLRPEEARQVLRLVYTHVKAVKSSVFSMEILQTLILQHQQPKPLFDQEDDALMLFILQDSIETVFHRETLINEETFTLFLNTILSFTLHEEYKHLLHNNTDIIPKLFHSYLRYDELVDSDQAYDRLKQLCFHAIKIFALISPLSVFHYSVFTPHVLRVIVHREIREETIADATVIISLAVEHSAAYDRELIPLCCSEIMKLITIDDEKAVFWVKLLATIIPRRSECDIDAVINHCLCLARKSGLETCSTKQAFILQTVVLLPFLKIGLQPSILRDYFNAVLQQRVAMTEQFLCSCMQAAMKHDGILQVFREPHHCRSFHLSFILHALQLPETNEPFSRFIPHLLQLSTRSMRFSNVVSYDSSASGVLLSLKRLVSSKISIESQQLVHVHSYFIAMMDVMQLLSSELSMAIFKAKVMLSSVTIQIILSMIPDPTIVLTHDSFTRLIWHSLASLGPSNVEFSASIVTFGMLTRHMDERAVALSFLCASFDEGDDKHSALESYWSSCTAIDVLIANLIDALIHQITRSNSGCMNDLEIQCNFLVHVIHFGALRIAQKCKYVMLLILKSSNSLKAC